MTDRARRRKPWLAVFTGLGVLATAALAAVGPGGWLLAMLCFVLASIGFFAANSLYDALLIDVAPPQACDRVSALGYALGYLGSALLFPAEHRHAAPARTLWICQCGGQHPVFIPDGCGLVGGVHAAAAVLGARAVAPGAHLSPRRRACRVSPAVPHPAGGARPAATAALSARLLAVHRRGLHDHQDGGGLRPVAGAFVHRGHRRDPGHQLHRLSGGDRLRCAR